MSDDGLCGTCGEPILAWQEMCTDKSGVRHHPKCLTGKSGFMLTKAEREQWLRTPHHEEEGSHGE